MKCKHCGSEVKPGYKFCEECGAPVAAQTGAKNAAAKQAKPGKTKPEKAKPQQTVPAAPASAGSSSPVPRPSQALFPDEPAIAYAGSGKVRQGIPAPGYSDRVNDPEILKAVGKRRRIACVFACILIPLPLIGFIVYSLVGKQMELGQAAMYGGIISGVFLLFALIGALKSALKKPYEAEVTDMKSHFVYRNRDKDNETSYTEYVTYIRTADGRKKKIKEKEGPGVQAYFYLEIGDRFRYHPKFNFPYEVYDKSNKSTIHCVNCCTENPIGNDRCTKCHIPLLK